MKTEIITLSEFGVFCNERACDGCWNVESAITCIKIYRECMSKPFWKRKRYFQKHYGETITKFVKDTYRYGADLWESKSQSKKETNGSMFLKTYQDSTTSNVAYDDGVCYVYIDLEGSRTRFTSDWWFATYKKESEEG